MKVPNTPLKISHTLEIISQCWMQAEIDLQNEIQEDYPGANEEFITQMFHGKFSKALRLASKDQKIEREFLRDLKEAFPKVQSYGIEKISRGLIADVVLHRRSTEAVTGGDIGLAMSRPLVEHHGDWLDIKDCKWGLLCQAKLKNAKGKWNKFSTPQKNKLGERLQYLGLLLYEYRDTERRELLPFKWQLCHLSSDLPEVVGWLKMDEFPSLMDSMRIIKGIGNGNIGTSDKKIIDEVITPNGNASLEITITWPDDKKPCSKVCVRNTQKVVLHTQLTGR